MSQHDTFLILHGWGGNKPEAWQEHLNKALLAEGATVFYPKMPEPGTPCLAAWLTRLHDELRQVPVVRR